MCKPICLCNLKTILLHLPNLTKRMCVYCYLCLTINNCRMYTFFAHGTIVASVVIPPMGLTFTYLVVCGLPGTQVPLVGFYETYIILCSLIMWCLQESTCQMVNGRWITLQSGIDFICPLTLNSFFTFSQCISLYDATFKYFVVDISDS